MIARSANVTAIFRALERLQNRYTTEGALHHAIATLLARAGLSFEWEHPLTDSERIDFEVGLPIGEKIGIEVKTAGGEVEHLRQLYRYAPHYDDLILVTTRASCPEDQELCTMLKFTDNTQHICRLHVLNLSLRL
jgi:hypothetical protein